MTYEHPVYTTESVAAQRELPALNTGRTAFADTQPSSWQPPVTGARSHRVRLWLVDLDHLPQSNILSFRARDHLGSPIRSIRGNLTAWLASFGIPVPDAGADAGRAEIIQVRVQSPDRVLVPDTNGAPSYVVAEVHNTYGERHCHLGTRRSLGPHYARTLSLWRSRFLAAWDEVAPLGFDPAFERMWEFYLAYSEAGFRSQNLDVWQFGLRSAA